MLARMAGFGQKPTYSSIEPLLLLERVMKKILRLAMVVLVVVYFAARTATAGVDFTLSNSGSEALRSVTVQVTGRSYELGDIPPGGSKTVKLNPTSESHIELLFPAGRILTIDAISNPTIVDASTQASRQRRLSQFQTK
jgi:hypothetical protein